jgi:hypothetical protein
VICQNSTSGVVVVEGCAPMRHDLCRGRGPVPRAAGRPGRARHPPGRADVGPVRRHQLRRQPRRVPRHRRLGAVGVTSRP